MEGISPFANPHPQGPWRQVGTPSCKRGAHRPSHRGGARRHGGLAVVMGWLVSMASLQGLAAQESPVLEWPCDVVVLGTGSEQDRSPVVTGLVLQPAGDVIAVVGDDHRVRLCDRQTGLLKRYLEGHQDWVRDAEFTPDGRWLYTTGNDRRVLRWDLENGGRGELFAELDFSAYALAIDPQGRSLAVAGFGPSVLWYDLATGRLRAELQDGLRDVRALAFDPQGSKLAAGGRDGYIRVWSTIDGQLLRRIESHRRRIRDLSFLEDGEHIVSCGDDQQLRVTDLADADASYSIDAHPAKLHGLRLLDQGLIATAGTDNRIHVWDLTTRSSFGQLVGHEGTVTRLAFDGSRLYSAGFDTQLRIWRVNPNLARAPGSTEPRISREPGNPIE